MSIGAVARSEDIQQRVRSELGPFGHVTCRVCRGDVTHPK